MEKTSCNLLKAELRHSQGWWEVRLKGKLGLTYFHLKLFHAVLYEELLYPS